ncbi:MAG: hypothetical protein VYA54_07370, partial [Bdellovibrionota bacterium]|nr:hypothetical protein [Bdellovibrionota bacterium]
MGRLFLSMLVLCAAIASSFAQDDVQSELLDIREEERVVRYGEYAEVEITSTKSVSLEFANEVVPYGMELDQVDEKTYVLYGQVAFLGKLCFLVDAQVNSGESTTERLCLYGDENEDISYPKFTTERFLDSVIESNIFSRSVEVEADVAVRTFNVSDLPEGLAVVETHNGADISGRLTAEGLYEIVIAAQEKDSEVISYKQFVIEAFQETPSYQCAPGYYWDEYLQYCVQATGRLCGELTFYDYETGRCVPYTRVSYCRAGTQYDHFLNRCVRIGARRCPLNYEYDHYYNRCVRLPYSCHIGSRYDYRRRTCVPVRRVSRCAPNSYYDSYRNRCLPRYRACTLGSYFNGRICVRHARTCSGGRFFDPTVGRCVTRVVRRNCGPGSVFDRYRNTCSRRVVNRTCAIGSRYSSRSGRCVRHDDGRINRRPNRPHRPVVTRPNRPNRPDRPTTRPNRPNRPDRPTTRPNRPNRPDRPTTRPDRPNRPDRPTTRPDRP